MSQLKMTRYPELVAKECFGTVTGGLYLWLHKEVDDRTKKMYACMYEPCIHGMEA